MIRVLLNCAVEHVDYFKRTILGRSDIALRTECDLDVSLRSLITAPPSLYLIRGIHTKSLKVHLMTLEDCFSKIPFQVALMCDLIDGTQLPFCVQRVFPATIDVADFNDAIAGLLDIPTRKAFRFPARIALNMCRMETTAAVSTINISATGMLVESSNRLVPGEIYQIRFKSLPLQIDGSRLSGRVVREMACVDACSDIHHYSVEFVGMPLDTMESMIRDLGA